MEEAWRALELVVLPHKETKDVFILGSTEEVQTTLDESNININTIASSRHVGPIKARVDDWIKQLDLFSKTLVISIDQACGLTMTPQQFFLFLVLAKFVA